MACWLVIAATEACLYLTVVVVVFLPLQDGDNVITLSHPHKPYKLKFEEEEIDKLEFTRTHAHTHACMHAHKKTSYASLLPPLQVDAATN